MIYITCILIVFITATVQGLGQERGGWNANPEWYITRDKWSHDVIDNPYTTEYFDPLKVVVIQDTETFPCLTFDACAEAIRKLQAEAINKREIDVPYNFLIGNDGKVYEGRGWGLQGDQNFDVNRCSLKIGFIGDYREEHRILIKVTEVQLTRTKMLLQQGVALGYLQEDYLVVGARDLLDTGSPGSNLYNAIQKWDHYDHKNRYKGLTCEEIYSPEEEEDKSSEEEDKTSEEENESSEEEENESSEEEEEDESSEEEVEESSEEEVEESSEEGHSEEDDDDDDDDDDDEEEEEVEKPGDAWFIPRETWKALEVNNPHTTAAFDPLKLVVIHHTVTAPCFSLDDCADAMRRIQISVMNNQEIDVPYNFVIGNDGRVYEARGWGVEGAQRFDANRCSLTIGFIGNYETQTVTEEQLERAKMIINEGVRLGQLVADYLVVGARDLTATVSPGANLYRAIKQWKEYDHQNRYKGMTCEQIYADDDWFIPRETWKALEVDNPHTMAVFDPLKLVVIHHTVTAPCFNFNDCADAMRRIQISVMNNGEIDVPYNFVIGNDGRVYEARGWGVEGAQRFDANRCSLTIGFIGNYETQPVTEEQLERAKMIINEGVRLGHLVADYLVVGARDLTATVSPGANLYRAIQQWAEYDDQNRYKGMTCEQIYADDDWFVPRVTWKALEVDNPHTTAAFDPLKLVVIHHTVTAPCFSFNDCADAMRRIQTSVMNSGEIDVPYNFVIGNDGRVYEARGWGVEGAQRFDANRCSLTIGFIGNYETQSVTEIQLERAKKIITEGVELGYLVEDYLVVGARDLTATVSPGANLYRAIQQWKEYDHQNRYRGMTCEQIYGGRSWFVPRDTWRALEVNNPHTTSAFDPLKLVVIHHTVTAPCFSYNDCSDAMRRIQISVMNNGEIDVPYNFVIGNDGRVYEARGWGVEGAQRFDANRCSLTIGFIGNYEEQRVTEEQLERAKLIIKKGVELGHLVEDYLVVGARDLTATVSPGVNLYRAIQQWKEYDHQNRYRGMTCEQIYAGNDWFVPRVTWKAQEVNNPHTTKAFDPLKLVVIHHTVTAPCFSLNDCSDAMRRIQTSVMNNQEIDVPYNFVIGNDGRVYEARGWGVEGAQRFDANRCSLTIGFIGNYETQTVTGEQQERAKMIINQGVRLGHLVADYLVVGARDLTATVSPGANLYRAIQQWKEYDHRNRYKGMTCEQIYK